jgi:2-iminobutanoate/2-iminopropanoate deaminase
MHIRNMEVLFMKKIISTPKAPSAIGPYSQAVVVGDMVYTSGMIPIIPETGELETGDIKAQATQAIKNLVALLEASGASADSVVKTTVFIKDMNDFAAVNEVYATFFTDNFPARSCVEVARLPKDVKIEIEAVATLNK